MTDGSKKTAFQLVVAALAAGFLAAASPSALASTGSPQWTVMSVSNPTNFIPATNEVQKLVIAAGGGTFTLTFEGQTTGTIPYNATPVAVQSALNGLSTIGGDGGSVSVTGGVGSPSGANPYVVTFEGSLADVEVGPLTINDSSLFDAVGDTVSCTGGPEGAFAYQWLRNGQPIAGATTSTYTTSAADEGDAIQCEVIASLSQGDPGSAATSRPARIVAPAPAPSPPEPPESISAPSGSPKAGSTLTCAAGSWLGSPTFTYQWLKNGAPIASATAEKYVVQGTDVPSNLQCEVIGTNAGGSEAEVSLNRSTSPSLEFNEGPPEATASSMLGSVTTITRGGSVGTYRVTVMNTGGAVTDGSAITVTDTLPGGTSLGAAGVSGEDLLSGEPLNCVGTSCTFSGVMAPGDFLTLTVPVSVNPGAGGTVTNTVSVSGGGATVAVAGDSTTIGAKPAAFGIAPGSAVTALSSPQAGAHADLTTMLAFNTGDELNEGGSYMLAGNPRSTVDDLPPGFAGDSADAPRCSVADFSKETAFFGPQTCPLSTQVGTTTVQLDFSYGPEFLTMPVYNLTPNPGEAAKLGFFASEFGIQGEVSIRPGDYGIRTTFTNIDETPAAVGGAVLSIWGVPAEPSHDLMRGLVCDGGTDCSHCNTTECVAGVGTGQSSTSPAMPLLTNPTSCPGASLQAQLTSASWQEPNRHVSAMSSVGPIVGCDLLEFNPWLTATFETSASDSPTGLTTEVKVPQEGLTSPNGRSSADIKNTTVTLPPGFVVNPGRAQGLVACQVAEDGVGQEGPASCPGASRIGTAQVETPLLREKLEGGVYVLQSNPPDLKLLITAYDPADGIYVKLPGDAHLDLSTGQVTTTFEETPQLPFSDLKLTLDGGAKAALVTAPTCGAFSTSADFTPWTAPIGSDNLSQGELSIASGPNGSSCPSSPLPFAPLLTAGSTSDKAGGFTGFSMELQRGDDQQRVQSLSLKMPEGVLGMVSKVPLCGEPQAAQGTCPAASQIGHTFVNSGPGPFPLTVPQPGDPQAPIYLTGGYRGAPYGVSIVVPVIAGPFNLGTVVVRAKIEVDRDTGQIVITTDPLPRILDGVPTDLTTISAVIDRPGFVFNPTDCSQSQVTGTVTGEQPDGGAGSTVAVSSPFAVTGCKGLPFKPSFTASVQANTSKAMGASLHVKVTSGAGQANIGKVRIVLPKQLPARLTTLQKACPDTVFDANPSACPAASAIGTAIAHTPVLTNPLVGPVYLVSHGGVAFPDAVIVLQGEGITLYLDGNTNIKKGITSSTFNSVPDAPITGFETTLPEGPHSAFATDIPAKAKGSLCKQTLKMPTVLTGQNGAVVTQTTKIAVTGCPKSKVKKGKKASSTHHGKGKTTKKK